VGSAPGAASTENEKTLPQDETHLARPGPATYNTPMTRRRDKRSRSGIAAWEVVALLAIVLAVVIGGRLLIGADAGTQMHALTVQRLQAVCEALDKYGADNGGSFPAASQGLAALIAEPAQGAKPVNWHGPYLKDPAVLRDAWGRDFHYVAPGAGDPPRPYDLWSLGADGREGGEGGNSDVLSWDRKTWLPPRP
jgi:general secretion pathway protein G